MKLNLTPDQHKAVLNLVIGNGNLQSGIMLDNPHEILKAVHFMARAQDTVGVELYSAEQLQGIEQMAIKRMAENKAIYLGDISHEKN